MISLNIDKLSNMTKEDAAALRAIADVYHPLKVQPAVAGVESAIRGAAVVKAAESVGASLPTLGEQFLASVKGTAERTGATVKATTLHPHDNPAFGAPDQHALADQVFSGGAVATFGTSLYRWSIDKPAEPNGRSMYHLKTGAIYDYNGTDGWSIALPPSPGIPGAALWQACKTTSVPAGASAAPVTYDGATVSAVSIRASDIAPDPAGVISSGTINTALGGNFRVDATGKIEADPAVVFGGGAVLASENDARVGEFFGKLVTGISESDRAAGWTNVPPPATSPEQFAGTADPATGTATFEADPAALFSHGSAELDADAAKLEALAGPGAAGPTAADVFSGGATGGEIPAGSVWPILVGEQPSEQTAPNVQSGTPIPPPSPPVTLQTSPPPSPAATTGSPPPPPPPAPGPVSASGAAPTTSGVQVDSAGLPWDARIHASTKTMTAKNVWTRRRGVEDSLVVQVEAQLRAAMAVPAPPPMPMEPLGTPGKWPFPVDSSSVTGAAPTPTFPTLMQFITERIGDKRLTQEQVTAAVQAVGLESLNLVMTRVDLVPQVLAELKKVAP